MAGETASIGRVAAVGGGTTAVASSPSASSRRSTRSSALGGRASGSFASPSRRTRVDGAREVGADVARDRDLGLDVGARLRGRVVDVEGPRAGEQLERDDGERVAVARGRRGEAAGLLGRDVGGGAEDLAGLGDRRLAGDGRDPEVADREAAVVVEQQVAGLDVAVDDVVAVRAVERDRGLAQPAQRDRAREPAALAQPVGDGPAGEVLHDHEGAVVVLADVVDGDDVAAVAELGGGARLAEEPAARALVGVVGAREDLDRDEPPEELVLGGPHRGHAPVGDMPQHAIPGRERDPLLGCRHRAHATRAEWAVHSSLLMAKVCHSCGKGPAFGNNRSHSMVATRRRFDPNLQKVRVLVGKAPKRVYVCTRCLKAGKVTKAV